MAAEGQGKLEVQKVLCPPNTDPGKLPHVTADCVCVHIEGKELLDGGAAWLPGLTCC